MSTDTKWEWTLVRGPVEVAADCVIQLRNENLTTRLIDSRALSSEDAIFDIFFATMQFPFYFGRNWHAFDDSFGDLARTTDLGDGLALVFMHGESADQDNKALADLVTSLGYAHEEWLAAEQPVRLSVSVQIPDESLMESRSVWEAAGVQFKES